MCEKTGIMLYCYKHDQGVMVMSDKVPHNINVGCFPVTNGKHPSQCCDWEDVGTFKIKNNGTVSLVGQEKQWYDDNNACWCEDDFLDNLYDNVISGGAVIFDEYYSHKYPGARVAVNEFFLDKKGHFEKYLTDEGHERWCFIKK